MAYLGQQPVVGRYILLDQISGGFNGTASGFTMSTAAGAQGVIPGLAQNVLLSLGGVIQQPGVDYTISGSGLTFTTPPVSGTTFFATVLGDAQSVGTPSDGTVTPASIASGFDFVFPNLSVTGVHTIASGTAAIPSLTITGDTDTGLFSPAANVLAITTSGIARARFKENGQITLFSDTPSSTASGVSFGTNGGDFRVFTGNTTTVGNVQVQGGANGTNPDAATSIGAQLNLINTDTTDLNTTQIRFSNSNELSSSYIAGVNTSHTGRTGDLVFGTANGAAPNERIRINSSGSLLIGRNAVIGATSTLETYRTTDNNVFIASTNATTGNTALLSFGPANEVTGAQIICEAENDFSVAANRTSRLEFYTRLNGTLTERFRIRSNGDVTTTTDASFTRTTAGFTARAGDSVSIARQGAGLEVARLNTDGALVQWFKDSTGVGTVSVAGGTVSYNPFLGSHWARLEDDSKPEILVGTVLETINKLIDWRIATFTVNGEQKISTYHGPANVGDTVQIEYEGQTYDAIVSLEEDPTDSLNKHVCVKVSDTAASAGVYGVFLGWDEDVQSEYINTWNDLYCAAVGNYFIRIAAGQTVAIGDLIESDGNGCGVVQGDDIIRSKTVGKVTSTIPQETYDDGSFLVTCVLCCG